MTRPLRNLSPFAEPWGRDVDQWRDAIEARLDLMDSGASNSGRMTSSGFDNMAAQIAELFARQTSQVSTSDMVTAYFGPLSSPPDVVRTVQLPRPGDFARMGWLSVQAAVGFEGPVDAMSRGYLTYELDGALIGAFSYPLPFTGAAVAFESGFSPSYSALTASPSSGGVLRITLGAQGLAPAGTRRVWARNIRATVQYGQRVV